MEVGWNGPSREHAGVRLHHEVVAEDHVPVHLGVIEVSPQRDMFAEARAAQLTVVHELQRDPSLIRTLHCICQRPCFCKLDYSTAQKSKIYKAVF